MTLLATGTRAAISIFRVAGIPLSKDVRAEDGKSVKGFFSIRLDRMDGIEENQTYFIRGFMADLISDPVEVGLD